MWQNHKEELESSHPKSIHQHVKSQSFFSQVQMLYKNNNFQFPIRNPKSPLLSREAIAQKQISRGQSLSLNNFNSVPFVGDQFRNVPWFFLHFYVILDPKRPFFAMRVSGNCPERQFNFLPMFCNETKLIDKLFVFPLWEMKSATVGIKKIKMLWWQLLNCGAFWWFLTLWFIPISIMLPWYWLHKNHYFRNDDNIVTFKTSLDAYQLK